MWTKRNNYITSLEEIKTYLDEMDNFHDHCIGCIYYNGNNAKITVEEFYPSSDVPEKSGYVWDFSFEGINNFQIDCDCVVGYHLNEITIENNEFIFNCTNGSIIIKAAQVKLGIPSTGE